MKWLAYDPDDSDRSEAKQVTGNINSAQFAARVFAFRVYSREVFEKYMDVTVIEIADDGTETVHEFTVDVDHEPVFRARPRT